MRQPLKGLTRPPRRGAQGTFLLLPLLALLLPLGAHESCPCVDPGLCHPIRHHPDSEIFVFDVGWKTWIFYDWSHITTVAAFGKYDPELMCYAHSKGVRVVLTGDVPVKDISDPIFRAAWITQKLDLAKAQFMDGINIDIEEEVDCFSPEYEALTILVKETTDSFHHQILGSQVSFDVPWSPKSIDKRCYNYSGIADACDFLFVMSYDEQSQIWGECVAAANAPYNQTLTGYNDYIQMGIDPKKLVMGVPWYGYDYTCLNLIANHACTIAKVSFRGAPCSDVVGSQVPYKVIMKHLNSSVSGSQWDEDQQAPFYNYKDSSGHYHQVWYDNPQSISLKAAYVQKHHLRGIGMWNADCLEYAGDFKARQQSQEMWQALKPRLG